MKIVHLTDLHLGPRELVRFGADQHQRLAAAIDQINALHADAALCVITGDLADRGDLAAYEDLRAELKALALPYRLILGNHDQRCPFLAVFPETVLSPGGFVQSEHDQDGVRLIFLDTLHHFPETYALVEEVKARYGVPVAVYTPEGCATVAEFEAKFGERLWETDEERYDFVVKVRAAPAPAACARCSTSAVDP